MGVSVSYIKSTEAGNKPSLKYLFAVVNNCNVSFDWLLIGGRLFASEKDETTLLLDKLRELLNHEDPDIRAWAKVQIKKSFAEYFEE